MQKRALFLLSSIVCLFVIFISPVFAIPITSGGMGMVQFEGNDINHSEFLLKVNIKGVFYDQDFYVHALDLDTYTGDPWDDNFMTFTSTAASTDFNNYQVTINWDDITGSADFSYSGAVEAGGFYDDVVFSRISMAGTISELSTATSWSFDIAAYSDLVQVPEPEVAFILLAFVLAFVGVHWRFSTTHRKLN